MENTTVDACHDPRREPGRHTALEDHLHQLMLKRRLELRGVARRKPVQG
jgi:hypothetical protein